MLLAATSCADSSKWKRTEVTTDDLADLILPQYKIDAQTFSRNIDNMVGQDGDRKPSDLLCRQFYKTNKEYIWVDENGLSPMADTLVEYIKKHAPEMGFTTAGFLSDNVINDIERASTMTFDSTNTATNTLARLEYALSKAYLGMAVGERYGFVDPNHTLNHVDLKRTDNPSPAKGYQQLYDVKIEKADADFVNEAFSHVRQGNLTTFLASLQPQDELYQRLKDMLQGATDTERDRILVNMERLRWRQSLPDTTHYVVVNIPAYELWAVRPDTILNMRIACGTFATKTPLLNSRISYIEVNPEWKIPFSIIKNEVANHAGDSAYFARNRYYVVERSTGKKIEPETASFSGLRNGEYAVAQEAGAGNSLGRLIFRFPNNFAVYLHDTSSPSVFQRENRSVSHGCVRVQKPFELAQFLLPNADDWTLDKIRLSIGRQPLTEQGKNYRRQHPDDEKTNLVRIQYVNPKEKLFITYQTIFVTPQTKQLNTYPDVYGYDKILLAAIKPLRR